MQDKNVLVLALFLVACGCGSIFYFSNVQNNMINTMENIQEESWREFQDFIKKFNKTYEQMNDLSERYNVFHNNYLYIKNENAQEWHNYTLGVGPFADLTEEEFAAQYLTYQHSEEDYFSVEETIDPPSDLEIKQIDWCSKGYCNPIRSQKCGDCWAHASTAGIEMAYKQKTGKLLDFSEQQIVDCAGQSKGCSGGNVGKGFTWVQDHGAMYEKDYPYRGNDGPCTEKASKFVTKISSWTRPTRSEAGLKTSLKRRPTAVGVSASWQHYQSGVYNGPCEGNINHAVVAVGYGQNYFKIRNSWGKNWGDNGHILLYSEFGNGYGKCKVAQYPLYAIV